MRSRSSIRYAVGGASRATACAAHDKPLEHGAGSAPDPQTLETVHVVQRRCTVCDWEAQVVERGLGEDPLCPWCHAATERAIVGVVVPEPAAGEKDPIAASLGRRGGLKGGPARAQKLSAKRRKEIASKAARARWRKKREPRE